MEAKEQTREIRMKYQIPSLETVCPGQFIYLITCVEIFVMDQLYIYVEILLLFIRRNFLMLKEAEKYWMIWIEISWLFAHE